MALKVSLFLPIRSLVGKLSKQDTIHFKHIWGKLYAVMVKKERTYTAHERKHHRHFGEWSKLASKINRDETLAAPYNDWKQKGYVTRYHYIFSVLSQQDPTLRD